MNIRKSLLDTNDYKNRIEHILKNFFPIEGKDRTLRLDSLDVEEGNFSIQAQKDAKLKGKTLHSRYRGSLSLIDNKTKKVLDKDTITLFHAPFYTEGNTLIIRGNEMVVGNQRRIRPGIYTKPHGDGTIQSFVNIENKLNFTIVFEPDTRDVYVRLSNHKYPIYAFLLAMGASEQEIKKTLGAIFEHNKKNAGFNLLTHYKKIARDLVKIPIEELPDTEAELTQVIQSYFSDSKLNPKISELTLNKPFSKVDYSTVIETLEKIKKVYTDPEEESDDLDSIYFNQILKGYERVVESLEKTGRKVARNLIYRLNSAKRETLKDIVVSGVFDPGVMDFIQNDTITFLNEQLNPIQMVDVNFAISSMGQGGIPSMEAVPDDLRHVLPSHTGVLDLVATPESKKAGVDLKLTTSVEIKDGDAVVELLDAKTLTKKKMKVIDVALKNVALPGQIPSDKYNENMNTRAEYEAFIKAMPSQVSVFTNKLKDVKNVPKSQVDYYFISPRQTQTFSSAMIPFFEHMFGARGVMAIKHHGQAMPLKEAEEPLVQSDILGKAANRVFGISRKSPVEGTVVSISDTNIIIQGKDKKKYEVELYNHYPLNAKTELHDTPVVKVGDKVTSSQIIAKNNFSDDKGNLAYGVNLNIVNMPYRGLNHEDGVVISQRAAQKLTSQQYIKEVFELDDKVVLNKRKFMGQFPTMYNTTQLDKLDMDGVIKKGQIVDPGDVLIAAYSIREPNSLDSILERVNRGFLKPAKNQSLEFGGVKSGVISEVHRTPKAITITISSETPATEGDKIVGRYGNKGSITAILPESDMPRTDSGEIADVIFTPAGIVSRINPGQILAGTAGKIAAKEGKPYLVKYGHPDNILQKLEKDLKKHGIKDKEIMYDPISKKYIDNPVWMGKDYIMKLHKSADTHLSARELGSYDSDEQPMKMSGRPDSAKSFGMMEANALLAANARENLRETALLKGQKNEQFWGAYKNNMPLPNLKSPFVFNKFEGLMTAAGVKMNKEEDAITLLPLTNKDILEASKGEIKNPRILKGTNQPESGGLFDPVITGGLHGENMNHIKLKEPVLSPVFKEAIALLLDMKIKDLKEFYATHGGKAVRNRLAALDLNQMERATGEILKTAKGSDLNKALKKMKIIKVLKKNNIKPDEVYVLDNVPVIPPKLRPLLPDVGGSMVLSDLNYLYKNILMANDYMDPKETKFMPDAQVRDLRVNLQNNMDKLAGIGYSNTPDVLGKKGAFELIAGDQPKRGFFQSGLMSKKIDLVGRGVLTPAPDMGFEQVGIPEDSLWTTYTPFIEKKLRLTGMSLTQAKEAIENRSPMAKRILDEEIKSRPVLLNRAPSLWRYNIPAAYPVPVSGNSIRLNPLYEAGMNADYDGDAVNFTPPVSDAAVEEARKMTLAHYALSDKKPNDLLASPKQEPIIGIFEASKKKWGKKK